MRGSCAGLVITDTAPAAARRRRPPPPPNKQQVVVFSKSYCPYCTKGKNALKTLLKPEDIFGACVACVRARRRRELVSFGELPQHTQLTP